MEKKTKAQKYTNLYKYVMLYIYIRKNSFEIDIEFISWLVQFKDSFGAAFQMAIKSDSIKLLLNLGKII